jgi:hypothetical protein
MLARVAPRLVSFEEQVAGVREALAALHERQEDWTAAAQTLAGIDLDSGALPVPGVAPPATCVRISIMSAMTLFGLVRADAGHACCATLLALLGRNWLGNRLQFLDFESRLEDPVHIAALVGVRLVEPEYKLAKYVKISMLYLEDDDAVNAETYIKKASTLIASCKVGQMLMLGWGFCISD